MREGRCKMDRYFEWQEKQSYRDFGLIMTGPVHTVSPEEDIEFQTVDGLDGELIIEKNRFKNTTKTYSVYIDQENIQQSVTNLSNWLKSEKGWHFLTDSEEPEYVYEAKIYESYETEQRLKNFGYAEISFVIKPYKFLKTGLSEQVLGQTIKNPSNRKARPKLIIKGTGNLTVQIGSEKLSLKNVDGGVIIDCLYQTATNLSGTKAAWDKVTSYPLPVIHPGKQTVLTTGAISEVNIIPRWEVLVG